MSTWLALLGFLVKLTAWVVNHMIEQKLLSEGEARAILRLQEDTHDRLKKVAKARADSVDDSANGGLLNDDGHKRD